jgi:hypothetical protein
VGSNCRMVKARGGRESRYGALWCGGCRRAELDWSGMVRRGELLWSGMSRRDVLAWFVVMA